MTTACHWRTGQKPQLSRSRMAGVAAEVDSREWHLSPADWERTLVRDARMTEQGILVLRFTPRRIRTAGREVALQIRAALRVSGGRRLPQIVARPAR